MKTAIHDLTECERTLIVRWWLKSRAAIVLNAALRDEDSRLNSPECAAATVAKFRDMGILDNTVEAGERLRDPHKLTGRGFAIAEQIMLDRKGT